LNRLTAFVLKARQLCGAGTAARCILKQTGTQDANARFTECSDSSEQEHWEYVMRIHIPCTTIALALTAAAPAAQAQTVYMQQPDGTVIAQEPVITAPAAPVVT
jgi:hypothetical protein